MAIGWRPRARRVEVRATLFGSVVPNWRELWKQRFSLDREALDSLLAGRLQLFGLGWLVVGNPPSWHQDPSSGRSAPLEYGKSIDYRNASRIGDIKLIWELNRHQHLVPLAVAWAIDQDERYRETLVRQLESWVSSNPFGHGVNWCSSLEVALRGISWAIMHGLLALGGDARGLFGLTSNPAALKESLYDHAWFIRHNLSRYSSANNHLIGELVGLWALCTLFDFGERGDAWRTFARRMLEREVRLQTHADGVNREQAFHYQLEILEYLLFTTAVARATGEEPPGNLAQHIERMTQFLCDVAAPGGTLPRVGDSDDAAVVRFSLRPSDDPYREMLATEAVLRAGGVAHTTCEKAFWFGAMAGSRVNGTPAGRSANPYPRIYRDGGYAILGGRRLHLLFDAGPLGYLSLAAHGHADALSICMAVDDGWWLVDPGTFAYHDNPAWRSYFRGTAAHNTIVVDGGDQSVSAGPFLWHSHARATLGSAEVLPDGTQRVEGSHDGYRRFGVTHRRRVSLEVADDRVLLADELSGHGEHEISMSFHLAPGLDVRVSDDGWLVSDRRTALLIQTDDRLDWRIHRGETDPVRGWYSAALGHKEPACELRGTWRGRLPLELRTCIACSPAMTPSLSASSTLTR